MRPNPDPRSARRRLVLALSGVAVALLAGGVAHLGLSDPAFARPDEAALGREAPELPREWRWEREAVSFDHMYMRER